MIVSRIAFCLAVLLAPCSARAGGNEPPQLAHAEARAQPVYRVPLRVHLGGSGRSTDEFLPLLEEINVIWLGQAGICFEMTVVRDDEPAGNGMDLWFLPDLAAGELLNGYYRNDHDIRVRDTPLLAPADRPARYPGARTAAHELGHGLGLEHRQDSDDNLMRSKTFGWQLSAGEIDRARRTAATHSLSVPPAPSCRIAVGEVR